MTGNSKPFSSTDDSGGPAFIEYSTHMGKNQCLAGVLSQGPDPEDKKKAMRFERVSAHVSWIRGIADADGLLP